jgi:hypothetical protein
MAVGERYEDLSSAVSGLTCVLGRDVFQRNGGTSIWQFALPEEFSGFGLDPLERMQTSPDGMHVSFVAVQGDQRRVGIAALPGHDVRILPYALSSVHGMSWSPDGRTLCIVAEDPSIGMVSIEKGRDALPATSFSLFLTGIEDTDLRAIAGPVVLPGVPRWSPAGDAIAVATQRHSGMETLSIMTTDGLAGDFVDGRIVQLGDVAWTNTGDLLCAVSSQNGLTHVLLVDVTTGSTREVDRPWNEVAWLSVLGERIVVVGRAESGWMVADVTHGTRRVLTQAFAGIGEVAAVASTVWMVTRRDEPTMELWTLDVPEGHMRLHASAPVIRDLHVRQSGAVAAVLAGSPGQETVQVYEDGLAGPLDLGHRDMVVGWIERADRSARLRHRAYLLDPLWQPVEIVDEDEDQSEPTLAPEEAATAPATLVSSEIALGEDSSTRAGEPIVGSSRRRVPQWVWWAVCLVLVAAVAGPTIVGALPRRNTGVSNVPATSDTVVDKPSDQTAGTVQTPPFPSEPPSAVEPGQEVATNPTHVNDTPASPKPTPSTSNAGGVAVGRWVAATESLHVRQGAGTDQPILGNLPPSGRAKVLAGPSKVGGMVWWHVQCYDAAGKQTLSGWVSGSYLKPASAPVTSTSPTKPAGTSFVAPAQGTLLVSSSPEEAIITVDGSIAGTTPTMISLPYGTHDISLVLEGYMVYNTSVTLKKPSSASEVKPVELNVGLIAFPLGG